MGYDLSNTAGKYVRFTSSGWDLALAAARHYGWQPLGIPKPEMWDEKYGPWTDEYWINSGQEVTLADAMALTTALERALTAPDFADTIIRLRTEFDCESSFSPNDAAAFHARLVEFANLTRQGPFIIE